MPDSNPQENQIDNIRRLLEENLRYTKTIHEFTPKNSSVKQEEHLKLIQDNLEYSKANYALLRRIKRTLFFYELYTILKLVLILVPLALAIIYLPPFLKNVTLPYLEVLKNLER